VQVFIEAFATVVGAGLCPYPSIWALPQWLNWKSFLVQWHESLCGTIFAM